MFKPETCHIQQRRYHNCVFRMPPFLLDDLPKPKTTELLQKGVESVQEYSALDERDEVRRWRVFRIGDQEHRVDMKAIEPYKRVISHGGQCSILHTHINTTTLCMSIFLII